MALDYLPFMGVLFVWKKRFERTDAQPISEREIQNTRWLSDVNNNTILGVG